MTTATTVFVYTLSRTGEVGAWSRYTFPFPVDAFAHMDEELFIRSGNDVLLVDPTATMDYAGSMSQQSSFTCTVQWPWLDFGQPGISKLLVGFDLTTSSALLVTTDIGYDQSNKNAFTAKFTIQPDTVPGTFIPMSLLAPSFSFRMQFGSSTKWTMYAVTAYIRDSRPTA